MITLIYLDMYTGEPLPYSSSLMQVILYVGVLLHGLFVYNMYLASSSFSHRPLHSCLSSLANKQANK